MNVRFGVSQIADDSVSTPRGPRYDLLVFEDEKQNILILGRHVSLAYTGTYDEHGQAIFNPSKTCLSPCYKDKNLHFSLFVRLEGFLTLCGKKNDESVEDFTKRVEEGTAEETPMLKRLQNPYLAIGLDSSLKSGGGELFGQTFVPHFLRILNAVRPEKDGGKVLWMISSENLKIQSDLREAGVTENLQHSGDAAGFKTTFVSEIVPTAWGFKKKLEDSKDSPLHKNTDNSVPPAPTLTHTYPESTTLLGPIPPAEEARRAEELTGVAVERKKEDPRTPLATVHNHPSRPASASPTFRKLSPIDTTPPLEPVRHGGVIELPATPSPRSASSGRASRSATPLLPRSGAGTPVPPGSRSSTPMPGGSMSGRHSPAIPMPQTPPRPPSSLFPDPEDIHAKLMLLVENFLNSQSLTAEQQHEQLRLLAEKSAAMAAPTRPSSHLDSLLGPDGHESNREDAHGHRLSFSPIPMGRALSVPSHDGRHLRPSSRSSSVSFHPDSPVPLLPRADERKRDEGYLPPLQPQTGLMSERKLPRSSSDLSEWTPNSKDKKHSPLARQTFLRHLAAQQLSHPTPLGSKPHPRSARSTVSNTGRIFSAPGSRSPSPTKKSRQQEQEQQTAQVASALGVERPPIVVVDHSLSPPPLESRSRSHT